MICGGGEYVCRGSQYGQSQGQSSVHAKVNIVILRRFRGVILILKVRIIKCYLKSQSSFTQLLLTTKEKKMCQYVFGKGVFCWW